MKKLDVEIENVTKKHLNNITKTYRLIKQTVNIGDNVFAVIPTNECGYIGKVKASAQNSGKIKIGQTANIRLANYPDR